MKTVQFYLTPAAGKALIAKGIAGLPEVREAAARQTLVIVAGTTNAYVAETLLRGLGQADGFDRRLFYRGIIKPGTAKVTRTPLNDDVVICQGIWQRGKSIFDVAETLKPGDVILKGANAVSLTEHTAAVLIGSPVGGTLAAASAAAVGRRVTMILPVGVEKRVQAPIAELCNSCNAQQAEGLRLWCAPGMPFTELDALEKLSGGAKARIFAAGGVCGAEGGCYFSLTGTPEQLENGLSAVRAVLGTPEFTLE